MLENETKTNPKFIFRCSVEKSKDEEKQPHQNDQNRYRYIFSQLIEPLFNL